MFRYSHCERTSLITMEKFFKLKLKTSTWSRVTGYYQTCLQDITEFCVEK